MAPHIGFIHELEERLHIPLPSFGHAADGNVHTHCLRSPLLDGEFGPEIPGWRETSGQVRDAIYRDVVRRNGVISGEHGIGLVKKPFLPGNISPALLSAMKSIKKALDPDGIMNPGKIFDL